MPTSNATFPRPLAFARTADATFPPTLAFARTADATLRWKLAFAVGVYATRRTKVTFAVGASGSLARDQPFLGEFVAKKPSGWSYHVTGDVVRLKH